MDGGYQVDRFGGAACENNFLDGSGVDEGTDIFPRRFERLGSEG